MEQLTKLYKVRLMLKHLIRSLIEMEVKIDMKITQIEEDYR